MVRLALRNYSVFLTECFVWKQNIFSRGGKNVFSAQSWFEYWSNKHFLVLGVFCFVVCFKRYVETCRKRNDASKTVKLLKRRFWEVLSKKKALVGVSAGPKFDLGVRQNLNLLAKWEYEIVSKRVSELLFFFELCVRKNFRERTNKFECLFFGWVSLTRLKFNTSFFWSYKTVIGFWSTCNESSNWFDVQVCS
jgi:hypothetical protein